MVEILFPPLGAQVQSLDRELRSHMPCGVAKIKLWESRDGDPLWVGNRGTGVSVKASQRIWHLCATLRMDEFEK